MTYREEMISYMNAKTDLVGYMPNEAKYDTGNPLLETGTAYVLLKELDEITDLDRELLINALNSCKAPNGRFFSKNPGTDDRISHDDIIGMVAGLSALDERCDAYLFSQIIVYGNFRHWIYTNTGKIYWDAISKPWHVAYYLLACRMAGATFLDNIAFSLYILANAFFSNNPKETSGKKLIWLMAKTAKGKSKLVDYCLNIWNKRTIKLFGSIKNMFRIYYGENHVFTKWIRE